MIEVQPPMAHAEAAKAGPSSLQRIAKRARALIRRNEISLIILGFLSGSIAGLVAAGILKATLLLHLLLFGHEHLSALARIEPQWRTLAPLAGGLLLGVSGIFI